MFYKWCRAMKEDGHTVFVSEYNMPSDFKCIWQKEVRNAMNLTSTKKPIEKLYKKKKKENLKLKSSCVFNIQNNNCLFHMAHNHKN